MKPAIDLVWLSADVPPPAWALGKVHSLRPTNAAVDSGMADLANSSQAEAVLFWDPSLGAPEQEMVQDLVASAVDCWHAGLKLGMNGLPGVIDFISPGWMLAADPPHEMEATSWRISLRACLGAAGGDCESSADWALNFKRWKVPPWKWAIVGFAKGL